MLKKIDKNKDMDSCKFDINNNGILECNIKTNEKLLDFDKQDVKPLIVNSNITELLNKLGQDVSIPVGYNNNGELIVLPIRKAPHILIAGCENSSVTIYVDSIITSMLCKYSTNELRLALFGTENSSFVKYNNVPHVLFDKVITEQKDMISVLQSLICEMENRYKLFANSNNVAISEIASYNNNVDERDRLPRIIVVINEFSVLFGKNKNKILSLIQSLAQKARATGIHLIMATEKPSYSNINSSIKCNVPTRIVFQLKDKNDSLKFLDEIGAEKLCNIGDCLFKSPFSYELERLQACLFNDNDIKKIVNVLKVF